MSLTLSGFAQDGTFELLLSDDTILIGNHFEIKYEAINLNGEFDLPDFEGFEVVSGPNQSSNFSINNGDQSSSVSLSFLLKPTNVTILSIGPAFFVTTDKTWEVGPRDVTVLPNPEGIVTESRIKSGVDLNFFEKWGQHRLKPRKKKKKLKETKI